MIDLLQRSKRNSLYSKKSKWSREVEKIDIEMEKHILPRLASEIIFPIEELDRMADRARRLGLRGEAMYDKGLKLKCSEEFLHRIVVSCTRLEYYCQRLRDLAETLFRGPVPLFSSYDCKFVNTEPIMSVDEKINRAFQQQEKKNAMAVEKE